MLATDPTTRFRTGLFACGIAAAALAVPAGPAALAQEADRIRPVTDAELENPSDDEWLMWRRTLDGWGYSPLDQIDRGNVGDLRLVWTRALGAGRQQGTPLVRDGVLFMPNPSDVIQALDAVTGDLIWEHRRDRPDDLGDYMIGTLTETNRNIAIHGELIIDTSMDDHIFALDGGDGRAGLGDGDPRLPREPGQPDLGAHRRRRQGLLRSELRPAGRAARLRHHRPRRRDRRGAVADAPHPGSPASRATRPGATCRSRSARTSDRGWCRATTRS